MIAIQRVDDMCDGVENIELRFVVIAFIRPQARQPSQHVAIMRAQADAVRIAKESHDQSAVPLIVASGIIETWRPVHRIKAEIILCVKFRGGAAQLSLELTV